MEKLKSELRQQLVRLKSRYQSEGFVILGVFGSFARGEENADSDIDLLYQIEAPFFLHNSGFNALSRLDQIKHELMEALGRDVDIAPKNSANRVLKEEVERDLVYV
ncbi:MAG: nucleotidyltransferase domain-containing protein [Candidatus Riflebacteria bacterium]|nr:nucleotidyltransferase domain-containing protein [Candidatus Riflebacteria bacterium]